MGVFLGAAGSSTGTGPVAVERTEAGSSLGGASGLGSSAGALEYLDVVSGDYGDRLDASYGGAGFD